MTPYECDKGWNSLIDPLVEELNRLNGRVLQIKEKFGGLRFYYTLAHNHPEAERFSQKVATAEILSFEICEVCGQPGTLRAGGWIRTLCEQHHQEREEKYKKDFT